ncbi:MULTISPECIES: UxaA family hydrolase [Sulfitobacter]|uniref:UxaA family hydrolase n=1 Tax=Sulfitobacter TaxID=60136 RepID=UPI002307CFA5|nr:MULTISPECIES: UxaA family hydrolase [Sulfitobacter]WCE67690.1 UxaA family hydrolase [Sulfitobacter faviae]
MTEERAITRGGRMSLTVHTADNVTTVLDAKETVNRLADGKDCALGVPFGHKVAICAIRKGEPIIKYGITIGTASEDICIGEHVHVHNVA